MQKKSTLDIVKDTPTSSEKKIESNIFGSTSASTLSAWKPEKSIFGSTSNTKTIFSAEPKVENKSVLSVGQEKTTIFPKPATEEKEEEKDSKPPAISFPSATFSFGQSSSTPSSAGFSFGG